MNSGAVVLFSGGQDSTICLAWALDRFQRVETIGFDYRQRHRIELEMRPGIRSTLQAGFPKWRDRLGDDHMIDLGVLGAISETALTRAVGIELTQSGLPSTFVPARNLIFLTMAAAVAYRRGISLLIGGMCETDFSGYPDCRDGAVKAMQVALTLGMDRPFRIETPLMWIDKAATWQLAHELGGDALVEIVRTQTHTCYMGERDGPHDWGFGCGECPACKLRAAGYGQWTRGQRAGVGQ